VKKNFLLDRVSLPIRVYDHVKRRIVANELPFGSKLTEDELAKELGISRTPIREALNRLAQEGIVTVSPGRGAFVATLSFDDMVQLLEIREALEGMAARLASNRITKETLEKLRQRLETEARKQADNAYRGYLDADREFHESVVSACGNHHLLQLMKSLRDRIQMIRSRSVLLPGRARKSFQEHAEIIDALSARAPDLAEDRIRTHIRNVKGDLEMAMANSPDDRVGTHVREQARNNNRSWRQHAS
jgi:DNA-binding GntR family transcriptional regulator